MNNEMNEIYRLLANNYLERFEFISRRPIRNARYPTFLHSFRVYLAQAIQESIRAFPDVRVRSDAEYFLLLNFMEMVFVPLTISDNSKFQRNPEQLSQMIRSDTRRIIEEAAKDGPEISGHSIVSALHKLWKELAVSELNLWG